MDLYDKNAETMMKFKPKTYQQVRLENAADAWKIHKSVYLDTVTGDPQPGFQAWPQFRDEFLIDWKSNRRLVTDKEADVHFDKIADESLSELENIGSLPVDVNALADEVVKADYEGQTNDESPEAAMLPTASVVVVATGEPVVEATVTMGESRLSSAVVVRLVRQRWLLIVMPSYLPFLSKRVVTRPRRASLRRLPRPRLPRRRA